MTLDKRVGWIKERSDGSTSTPSLVDPLRLIHPTF